MIENKSGSSGKVQGQANTTNSRALQRSGGGRAGTPGKGATTARLSSGGAPAGARLEGGSSGAVAYHDGAGANRAERGTSVNRCCARLNIKSIASR